MPTLLNYFYAYPGIPFPNHSSGKATPQSFILPGAAQPFCDRGPLYSYPHATTGAGQLAFPQHSTAVPRPINFLFQGAVQPFEIPTLLGCNVT